MPEGDTIYQTAAALRPILVGQPVLAARGRTPGPQLHRLVGAHVTAVEPLGKHMVIRFDNGLALHTHLRMTGTWHRYAPGEPWRIAAWKAKVVLEVPNNVVVCFNAPVAELMPDKALDLHPAMRSIGPDLLGQSFDAELALANLQKHLHDEIAEALLDQRVMAGIGNVYKSEILFIHSVNPWTPVRAVPTQSQQSIIATARKLLLENVKDGRGPHRITTRGDSTAHGASVYVYGRAGRPCRRCGTPIRTHRQGALNRPTYWCPRCQPDPAFTSR